MKKFFLSIAKGIERLFTNAAAELSAMLEYKDRQIEELQRQNSLLRWKLREAEFSLKLHRQKLLKSDPSGQRESPGVTGFKVEEDGDG